MKGLLLSFILLFWGTFSVNAQNRSIRFLDDNWNIVLKKAERTGKLIFVDCYTSWCGPLVRPWRKRYLRLTVLQISLTDISFVSNWI